MANSILDMLAAANGKVLICRLCMKCNEDSVNIFASDKAMGTSICEVIRDLLNIEVLDGDGLPDLVCCVCLRKLLELSDFKEMCLMSARELRQIILEGGLKIDKKVDVDPSGSLNEGGYRRESLYRERPVSDVLSDPLAVEYSIDVMKERRDSGSLLLEEESHQWENVDDAEGSELNVVCVPLEMGNMHLPIKMEDADMDEESLTKEEEDDITVEEENVPFKDEYSGSMDENASDKEEDDHSESPAKEGSRRGKNIDNEELPLASASSVAPLQRSAGRVKETTPFIIPKESLDLLFSEKKECFSQPTALPDDCELHRTPVTECFENNGMDCVQTEVEEPVEYCWCSECNAEFLSKGELRIHMKTHKNAASKNSLCEATDSVMSSEEYKLISGEVSVLKSRLCCSRCQKEFKNEKSLVKHMKHDFKCKPRNFECLNSLLKSLKPTAPEHNTLLNIQSYNSSSPVDSKICESKGSPMCISFNSVRSKDSIMLLEGSGSKVEASSLSRSKAIVSHSKGFPINKSPKISRVSTSFVGSHPLLGHSTKQDICSFNTPFIDGNEMKKDVSMLGKAVVSTHECRNPTALSPLMEEKSIFGKVMSVDGGIVICDYCNKSFTFKSKLREHMVLCHLSIVIHKCFTCYNVFASESELRTHCAVHTSRSKYICTVCNDNFSSKRKLTSHLKEVHKLSKARVCCVCLLGFSSQAELGLHQLCHKADKKYKCSKCGKAYLSKKSYNIHVCLRQMRNFAYCCEICGKKFVSKQDMDGHANRHESVKRFVCLLCPKSFTQIGQLNLHIRKVHLELKPHECGICKKKFSVRNNLKNHYAVHSDDRPFSCELCGKTFKLKLVLSVHKKKCIGDV